MISHLPEDVRAALARGNKIGAIRLLRKHTGIGLAEAKAAIDAGQAPAPRPALQSSEPLPLQVTSALAAGKKIEAIKLLREATGVGLREAKLRIDAAADKHERVFDSGEVPRSSFGSGFLLFLAVILVAVLGWLVIEDDKAPLDDPSGLEQPERE